MIFSKILHHEASSDQTRFQCYLQVSCLKSYVKSQKTIMSSIFLKSIFLEKSAISLNESLLLSIESL